MFNISQIVFEAVRHKSSDIHICPGAPISVRVDGSLIPLFEGELSEAESDAVINEIMLPAHKQHLNDVGEADFSVTVGNYRLRVNAYKQMGTNACAIRILSDRIGTMEELGLPSCLKQLEDKKHGLIIVSGITGSGKSTTLASLVNALNHKYPYHIVTIEDPIEYLYPSAKSLIHQREIGADTLSFPAALRAALRQDPDVILVGEMRDTETISTAITAAETGHLVLSTLHTNGSANTIDRIIDVFPAHQQQQIRYQLAGILECVITQQLLPKKNSSGRVLAYETMFNNSAIRNLIRESKTFMIPNTMLGNRAAGNILMDDCLYDLYARGLITAETAILAASDPLALKKKLIMI